MKGGLLLALALTLANVTSAACAREVENFSPDGPVASNMQESAGESAINNFTRTAEALDDYSLIFEAITFKKNHGTIEEKGKLFFKKPHLMRLEEIGDFQKGSIVVIGADGKAHARGGGLARFITLTLDPKDKQLNAANGDRMIDSDFASLAHTLAGRLGKGQKARGAAGSVTISGAKKAAEIVELYEQASPARVLKRIYFDPHSHLPLRWDDYDYAMPCSSTWSEVKLNPGLSADLFKL